MKEGQKYFIITTILFIIIAIIIMQFINNKKTDYMVNTNKDKNSLIKTEDFGIYLQNKEDKTKYDKQASNEYPTEGYILNEEMTC